MSIREEGLNDSRNLAFMAKGYPPGKTLLLFTSTSLFIHIQPHQIKLTLP
jgi:hypothetical protein